MLRHVVWTPTLSVGRAELDAHHRKLIAMLNDFLGQFFAGQGDGLLRPLLDELLDYTRYHFREEEAVLAAAGYPGVEAHRIQHRHLIEQLQAIIDQMGTAADVSKLGTETLNFLGRWLVEHIQDNDLDYAHYLERMGRA